MLSFCRLVLILGVGLLASACASGGSTSGEGRGSERSGGGGVSAFSSQAARQCVGDLKSAKVRFTPLANRHFGRGCRAIDAVKLVDIGTPTANLGWMTCPLARSFAAWVRYAARPAARKYLKRELVKVETFGTYSCRTINSRPSAPLSQHAFGNAVDVSGFLLSDGRRILVVSGWKGDAASRQFLRAIHKSACRRFGTVLSPDYDAAHHNHFHLDMSGNGYCG